MTTDNKTLADVQPGGRVRLGDQAELDRLEFQTWARELLPCPFCGNGAEFVPYKDNGLTLKCKSMGCIQRHQRTLRYGIEWLRTSMTEHWNARALSAQPSPGGQRDDSPMAKMAAALREKAAMEHTEYSQRVQSGEWGPMPEAETEADFCQRCTGSGWDGESREAKCPACSGAGIAARQPVESEENVAADTYWTLAEMIEPHVQREGINPDGALPASVHDSVAILLEHWLRTRQPVGEQRAALWIQFAKNGNIQFWTKDQDRAVAESFLHARPLTAFYASPQQPAQAVDHEVTDAMVDKAWNRFEAALHADDGDTPEDRVLSETIDQRDRYHEMADELAGHIARIIGVDIGEHSSANCPWQNAIEAAEEYKPAQAVDLVQEHVATLAVDDDGMLGWSLTHIGRDLPEGEYRLALIDSHGARNG